jgi:integrase/recombinase XerD
MGKFHDLMDREIRIRGLAENTRKSYLGHMRRFVRHFMTPPDQLTIEHVKQFQLFLTKDRAVSHETLNGHVCAIRFFYHDVLDVDWNVERIPYQKTGKKLPIVLVAKRCSRSLRS